MNRVYINVLLCIIINIFYVLNIKQDLGAQAQDIKLFLPNKSIVNNDFILLVYYNFTVYLSDVVFQNLFLGSDKGSNFRKCYPLSELSL